jgi:phosphoribosyl 1,2-cyclic phosphate phosphodiesterase
MPLPLSVTVLGSGTSQGVPMIGCFCPVCTSTDPRDHRTRCSIYVQTPEGNILVDTTPELREQALREKISSVNAVLYTHAHADHIMGLDDLRRFCDINGGPLAVYASSDTFRRLHEIFDYAFNPGKKVRGYVHLIPHPVETSFELFGLTITPLPVPHGDGTTYGYLFVRDNRKLLAYISDCQSVPESEIKRMSGVDSLLIDGLRDQPHPTHLTIAGAIAIARAIGARQTYLTHLTHEKAHAARSAELPTGIALAYDGLKLNI